MTGKRNKEANADKQSTKQSQAEATTPSETPSQTDFDDIVHLPPDPFPPNVSSVGRPTKYDPSFNQLALNCAAAGKTHRGIAAHLGVSINTLYLWRDAHPEFMETMSRCDELFADYFEYKKNLTIIEKHQGLKLNNSSWNKLMARFPEYQPNNQNNSLNLECYPDDPGISKVP